MRNVIITVVMCLLILVSFVGGFATGIGVTSPVFNALSAAFDTSKFEDNQILVMMKDTKGIVFRKFDSFAEVNKYIEAVK